MLDKEYNHLLKCCKKLQSATIGIEKKLNSILSMRNRSFVVSFEGIEYNFFPPTTLQEMQEQEILKKDFILKLLLRSYQDMLEHGPQDNSCWDNILIFAMGDPIENYQIEKIKEENIEHHDNAVDNGLNKQIPLNEDSIYVQWQDQNKVKFEET